MASRGEQSLVDGILHDATTAWPTIVVPRERFVEYLYARADAIADLHTTDLYLACSCVDRSPQGLACFDEHHLRTLPARLRRLGLAESVLEEMQQILREKLLVATPEHAARISAYTGRGPLHAWVRAAAVRTSLNVLRATWREDLVGEAPVSQELVASPERDLRNVAYVQAVTDALRDATRELDAEDRLLLQLHFADGCSAEQIGRTLGINRVTAHRRLVRAYRQIERRALAHLRDHAGVVAEDLDSVLSIARSRLEVSVRTLLATS